MNKRRISKQKCPYDKSLLVAIQEEDEFDARKYGELIKNGLSGVPFEDLGEGGPPLSLSSPSWLPPI